MQELSFTASIATSVFLETEEDKTTFIQAIATELEKSADGNTFLVTYYLLKSIKIFLCS